MQAVPLLVPVAHGAAVAPVAVVPVGTPSGSAIFRTPRSPPRRVFHFNGININETFTPSVSSKKKTTTGLPAWSDISTEKWYVLDQDWRPVQLGAFSESQQPIIIHSSDVHLYQVHHPNSSTFPPIRAISEQLGTGSNNKQP